MQHSLTYSLTSPRFDSMLRTGTEESRSVQSQRDQQWHLQKHKVIWTGHTQFFSGRILKIQLNQKFQKHIRNINDTLWSVCLFEMRKLSCSKVRGTPPQPFPQTPHMTGLPGSLLCRSASTVSLLGDVLTQTSSGTSLSVISKT